MNKDGMKSEKLHTEYLFLLPFILCVFLLSIIRIEDTDTWMHLSLGKAIWAQKGMPATEPYVYTSFGQPFLNGSWLFGLLYYLTYSIFSIPGIIFLKAITITTAFFILVRDSFRPYKNYFLSVMVMVLVVFIARHRFAERPDTFMIIFLSFSIFSLNAYLYDKKKYIYSLPVIHMLWANFHTSINLMVVPFLSFIAGGILQRYLSKKDISVDSVPSVSQIKTVFLIGIASFAASLINPNFINQYYFGAQFLSTPWFKQEILELQRPESRTIIWLCIAAAFIALTFLINRKRLSVIHLMMVMPFIGLAFTAKRFLLLMVVVCGPIVVRNISSFLELRSWDKRLNKKLALMIVLCWIIFFTSYALIKGTPYDGGRKKFGFGVEYSFVPEFALQYLDRNNIEGRIFNIYEWGGYIIWRDYPKRTVFVDPRGNIPTDLLEKINLAIARPYLMDAFSARYGFDVVLINYPIFEPDIPNMAGGLVNPRWALVYWDDVSLVYLRRSGRYDTIIQRDEYRFVKPANGLSDLKNALKDETNRTAIIDELLRNIKETGSSRAYLYLGFAYNEMGMYKEAINELLKVRNIPDREFVSPAYNSLAYAYEQLGDVDTAIDYYLKILNKRKIAGIFYEIGRLYLKKGDTEHAVEYLKNAIETNKNYGPAYTLLIDIYRELGKSADFRDIQKAYDEVEKKNATSAHFKKGIEAYHSGRLDIAVDEFRKAIELNPLDAASYSNIGYIYYDMGNLSNAFEYQKKALEINPNFANAHYGMAMLYKRWGDVRNEKKYLEEYLRLEPSGYYSRVAKEEIDKIEKFLDR